MPFHKVFRKQVSAIKRQFQRPKPDYSGLTRDEILTRMTTDSQQELPLIVYVFLALLFAYLIYKVDSLQIGPVRPEVVQLNNFAFHAQSANLTVVVLHLRAYQQNLNK